MIFIVHVQFQYNNHMFIADRIGLLPVLLQIYLLLTMDLLYCHYLAWTCVIIGSNEGPKKKTFLKTIL